ncbi:MAG: DegT/DnrJ/EryC1/StrS family aminotransferase [Alphaproteobacteria bacterium]|nr:DegT/DnrJ/EryC1/StrS family aminotransferase [Alphaproteobacteria bacterium]
MNEFKDMLTVSKPDLPDFDRYVAALRDIWELRHVTNRGKYHGAFEERLAGYLGTDHLSLTCNGTIALEVALRALEVTGEVITTPFTFAATAHAIHSVGCTPVFCDIDPETMCLDPARIEALITPETSAIMPVHVYGRPCNLAAIEDVARVHGLKVIYDAAHAFGVRLPDGESLLAQGDISILSLHATKVFNTVEGGAVIARDEGVKVRVERLLNFGLDHSGLVVEPGTNGKMGELSAAWGVLLLDDIDEAIAHRGRVAARYRERLSKVAGLTLPAPMPGVIPNHIYFPVLVEQDYLGGASGVQAGLVDNDILARRYFYPLISNIDSYASLPSAAPEKLPVANTIAEKVLCLPIYSTLALDDVDRICDHITAGALQGVARTATWGR